LAYGLITDGVSAWDRAKPLVDEAIDQDTFAELAAGFGNSTATAHHSVRYSFRSG